MADGTTTNYGWVQPEVGASEDTWGTKLNANWGAVDTLLGGVTNTEFAILDGATVTTAELNVLDGIPGTLTATELGYVDGVTSAIQTQLDGKQAVVANVSDAEIGYLDGVTSAIQTQLNAKVGATYTGDVDITGEFIADSYNETYAALSGTSPAVNCETGNVFSLSTTGNTTFTFSNPPASGTAYGFTLKVTAGGTHTLTWPSSVDWAGGTAPDAPASGETNVLVFITHDGGTTWYGFQAGAALA